MKLRIEKNVNLVLMALTFSLLTGPSTAFSQEDRLLADTETVLNSEKIDIDGNWKNQAPKRKLTNKQIIKNARKKSKRNNIKQISKEIENIQVSTEQIEDILKKEDSNLAKGIDSAFGADGKPLVVDKVELEIAAVEKIEAPIVYPTGKEFKLIPSVGVTQISGDAIDFESNVNLGLAFEADIHPRFAVGVGVNYTTLDVEEIDRDGFNGRYRSNCGYFGCYDDFYNNTFGEDGRELKYKHLTLEVYSKFFFTNPETRFRPYVGLGLGYNRTKLRYDDSSNNNRDNDGFYDFNRDFRYGDESYTSNYVSGSALVGAEISFTETIGMNLNLKYTRGLSSGFGTSSTETSQFNSDQTKLDNIGEDIEDSDFLNINTGLLIKF